MTRHFGQNGRGDSFCDQILKLVCDNEGFVALREENLTTQVEPDVQDPQRVVVGVLGKSLMRTSPLKCEPTAIIPVKVRMWVKT